MSQLSDLQSKISELQGQMQTAFGDCVASFFRENPNVHIVWTQYAPYFNDGDPCTFSVHDPDVVWVEPESEGERATSGNTSMVYDIDDHDYEWGFDNTEGKLSKEATEQLEEIVSFIEAEQDLMQTLYGDDAKIVLSKAGADVSEYSHD